MTDKEQPLNEFGRIKNWRGLNWLDDPRPVTWETFGLKHHDNEKKFGGKDAIYVLYAAAFLVLMFIGSSL
jgi:hypothetical protein